MSATDADGFPTNVAANELIESAWGNAVASKLRLAPRAIVRMANGTAQGGHGAVETPMPGLSLVVPSGAAGRLYQVTFAVPVVQNTAPPANSSIFVTLRIGPPPGGASIGIVAWTFVANSSANGWTLAGTFPRSGFAAGSTLVLSTFSDGTGRYNLGAGGWAALVDVNSSTP